MLRAVRSKQQSAMEYLMTYGWSILIIAIVLAALYSLGVFGNGLSGPRVPANSCRVFRPNGPGTTTNVNLEGTCNNELPEYVGVFGNGYVTVANSPTLALGSGNFVVSVWIDIANPISGTSCQRIVGKKGIGANNAGFSIYFNCDGHTNTLMYSTANGVTDSEPWTTATFSSGIWYNVIMVANTLDPNKGELYINGVQAALSGSPGNYNVNCSDALTIGDYPGGGHAFSGSIANVQIYDSALDGPSIQALYTDGIGGTPVDTQYLVAWWPLNGDTNDYSGNGNVGTISSSVSFTGSWTSGYTVP